MPIIGNRILATAANFRNMVEDDAVIVDKTLFIKAFWNAENFSLITQPRRFGKSMTMSMLQYFCAASVDGIETKGLFDQFAIAQIENGAFLQKHQGQYPVIAISFKDVKEQSKNLGKNLLNYIVSMRIYSLLIK